jgi:hypothetical protein
MPLSCISDVPMSTMKHHVFRDPTKRRTSRPASVFLSRSMMQQAPLSSGMTPLSVERVFWRIVVLGSLISIGACVAPTSGVLIRPVGVTVQQSRSDGRECLNLASEQSDLPLSDKEKILIDGVETCRFFEGGTGRSLACDHYFLCFLRRDYQYIQLPVNWLLDTRCGLLSSYKAGGIEEDRLRYICTTEPDNRKCDVCQDLK